MLLLRLLRLPCSLVVRLLRDLVGIVIWWRRIDRASANLINGRSAETSHVVRPMEINRPTVHVPMRHRILGLQLRDMHRRLGNRRPHGPLWGLVGVLVSYAPAGPLVEGLVYKLGVAFGVVVGGVGEGVRVLV